MSLTVLSSKSDLLIKDKKSLFTIGLKIIKPIPKTIIKEIREVITNNVESDEKEIKLNKEDRVKLMIKIENEMKNKYLFECLFASMKCRMIV